MPVAHAIAELARLDSLKRSSIAVADTLKSQRLRFGHVVARARIGALSASCGSNGGIGRLEHARALPGAKIGAYSVLVTGPAEYHGRYLVADPDGAIIAERAIQEPFTGPQIAFELVGGNADFAPGDMFSIDVGKGSEAVREWRPDTVGTDVVAGVALAECFANNAKVLILTGDAIVARDRLVFFEGATEAEQQSGLKQLERLGIRAVDVLDRRHL